MQSHTKPGIAPENQSDGEHERHPFAVAVTLLFLALAHDVWIEADARIVHEYAAVDLSDIHFCHSAGEDVANGGLDAGRDARILGEVIQGADRENAKRGIGAYHRAGYALTVPSPSPATTG